MKPTTIKNLIHAYEQAPEEFKVTKYWKSYDKDILEIISTIDINQL